MIEYVLALLSLCAILGIAALALDLAIGRTGIIHLGIVGLMAVGAYTAAVVSTEYAINPWLALVAAMIVAGAVGGAIGFITKSLHGDQLAAVLLGFNFMVYSLALNWTEFTRGPLGIPGIDRPAGLSTSLAFALFTALLFGLAVFVMGLLGRSVLGRRLAAVRDDELQARVLGIASFRLKLMTCCVSGAVAGLSGGLYAQFVSFIDPASFFLPLLVLVLSIVFVGGLGSARGILLGSLIMTFVPEAIRFIPGIPPVWIGSGRAILFSSALLLIVLARQKGILGRVELPSSYAEGS